MKTRSVLAIVLVRALLARRRLIWLVATAIGFALIVLSTLTTPPVRETYCLRSPVPKGAEGVAVWDFEFADPDIEKLERARTELAEIGFAFDRYQYRINLHGELIELHVTREEALDQHDLDARHEEMCVIAKKYELEEYWAARPQRESAPRDSAP